MAVKKSTAKSPEKRGSKTKAADRHDVQGISSFHRFLLLFCLFFCVLLIGAAVFFASRIKMENPRLKLYRTEVRCAGEYWRSRGRELRERAGVREGQNMFSVNVGRVREKVLEIKSIEDAKVQLVLPDMILFELKERVPRAAIGRELFVDEKGVMFPKRESSASGQNLPEISGVFSDQRNLLCALDLIMTVDRHYRDVFFIRKVNIVNRNLFEVDITYNNDRTFFVKFPGDRSFSDLINTLNNAIRDAYLHDSFPRGFDLRNDGLILLVR
ncbi:MAG: FtsQ-type POTRA domain-containing protein [Lentisphaerae bacterium]|nr:FtsQ-type POTRA domain-containing protein [Lentisphaerota bacterium]